MRGDDNAADLKDCNSNLVENAVKYTNGPGEVYVAVVSGVDAESAPPTDPSIRPDVRDRAVPEMS
jgi:hypothetical protein